MIADGMMGTGQCACVYDNEMQTQEIAVQVGGGTAENQLAGVIINRIPRTGSNDVQRRPGSAGFRRFAAERQNIDDEQKAKGITLPGKLFRQYDVNYSLGGTDRERPAVVLLHRPQLGVRSVRGELRSSRTAASTPTSTSCMAYPVRLTSQLNKNNKLTGLFNWTNRIRQNYRIPNPGAVAGSHLRGTTRRPSTSRRPNGRPRCRRTCSSRPATT